MKSALRALRIGRVLVRYRLDELLDGTPAERWLKLLRPFVPRAPRAIASLPRGARLRLALQELGPIFVKFGQILSTRRDLVPPDVASELTLLQDRVAPFDGDAARAIVEQGHEISNHSLTHPFFSRIGLDGALSELRRTDQIIHDTTGASSRQIGRAHV